MTTYRSVVFAGGGSGGHLYPALAVAKALLESVLPEEPPRQTGSATVPHDEPRRLCDHVTFLTSDREIDRFIMERAVTELRDVTWQPYFAHRRGSKPIRFVRQAIASWNAWRMARQLIRTDRPLLCIGIGAVASVPGVMACAEAGVPVVLLEQNTVPGRSTRWLSRYAGELLAGHPINRSYRRALKCPVHITGVPVRTEIARLAEKAASAPNGAEEDTPTKGRLLILGGSQGAASLNELVARAILQNDCLPVDWNVTHQTGQSDRARMQSLYATMRDRVRVADFLDDIADELNQADLVIGRSGAGALAELSCAGRPSILIPLPHSASAHQLENARFFEKAGAAVIIDQTQPNAETQMIQEIRRLTHSAATRQNMASRAAGLAQPDAANAVISRITRFLHSPGR